MSHPSQRARRRKQQQQKQSAKNPPEWFHNCKSYKVFTYDSKKYPFKELMASWLGIPPESLETIHTLPLADSKTLVHPKVCQAWKAASMPKLSKEARKYDAATQHAIYQAPTYHRLMDTYRRFLKEVVAPLCHCENVVYQSPPTTRVVLPNGKPTIAMHSDKHYAGHQPAEINFWVPLTRTGGANSLFLESVPGKGDFEPVALEYGQALRFDGYECRHYTVANATEICRVSFDFRVVPSELCTQRRQCGDFCLEETSDQGYIAYPHKFWRTMKGMEYGQEEELSPVEVPLSPSS